MSQAAETSSPREIASMAQEAAPTRATAAHTAMLAGVHFGFGGRPSTCASTGAADILADPPSSLPSWRAGRVRPRLRATTAHRRTGPRARPCLESSDFITALQVSKPALNTRWTPYARSRDRKSTRLNSSHVKISYAVFCLKKKTEH